MAVPARVKWKICLIGATAVGKTSLIRRFVVDDFDDKYMTTLGTKVSKKAVAVTVPGVPAPVAVDLAIWDIMGQHSLMELLKDAYFNGAHGILAVADLTRRSTLDDLYSWVRSVERVAGPVPRVVAVNKSDLEDRAAFGPADVAASTSAAGCPVVFTSAKTGEHVEDAFHALADAVARRRFAAPTPR